MKTRIELPDDPLRSIIQKAGDEDGYFTPKQVIDLSLVYKAMNTLVKESIDALDLSKVMVVPDDKKAEFLEYIFSFKQLKKIKLPKWINDADLGSIHNKIIQHNERNPSKITDISFANCTNFKPTKYSRCHLNIAIS